MAKDLIVIGIHAIETIVIVHLGGDTRALLEAERLPGTEAGGAPRVVHPAALLVTVVEQGLVTAGVRPAVARLLWRNKDLVAVRGTIPELRSESLSRRAGAHRGRGRNPYPGPDPGRVLIHLLRSM